MVRMKKSIQFSTLQPDYISISIRWKRYPLQIILIKY
jgi:hypothetical protein